MNGIKSLPAKHANRREKRKKLYMAWKAVSDHAERLSKDYDDFSRELHHVADRMQVKLEE